jgi:hypothetical protein
MFKTLATQKQKNLLDSLGIPYHVNTLTIQEASEIIGAELKKRNRITTKQKALLIKFGYSVSDSMSKKDAAILLSKELANRPKTFYGATGYYDEEEWEDYSGVGPNDMW